MDALEQMLITKYGLDPEKAKALAGDIKTEAVTDQANTQQNNMRRMQNNAHAFKALHAAKQRGEAIRPEDDVWYNEVLDAHRNKTKAQTDTDEAKTAKLRGVANDELLRMSGMTAWGESETARHLAKPRAPQTLHAPGPSQPGDTHVIPISQQTQPRTHVTVPPVDPDQERLVKLLSMLGK